MSIDFVIREARVKGQSEPVAVAIKASRIVDIAPSITSDAPFVDAKGRWLSGGLTETHIHLDKAGIIGRCRLCEGTLAEAVSETARAKAAFTVEDVYARARRVAEQAITHGTNRLRTFVEIDPRAGYRSFEALLQVKRDLATALDLEICAFAQEGLTNDPETEGMLDHALRQGATSVGGCPYTDPQPAEHIRRIFDLAERHGVPVDFHVDFDLDPQGSNLPTIIAETTRRGYGGRVSVGHVTKLSALAPDDFAVIGRHLADAGVAVTVLPATDLFLMGRGSTHLIPRGMTPAHKLAGLGVTATLATNNVLNPFTPLGDASLVRMANLYATVAQIGNEADLTHAFHMISDAANTLLGLPDGSPRVGGSADLVLFDAPSPASVVAEIAPAVAGWKRGVATFSRPAPLLFL